MRDEYDMRAWVEHHGAFSELIGNVIDTVRVSLETLHAITFDTPWREDNSRCL